ncbi:hypothetical protein BDF19DRAFT_452863 [Syncephalis fuscata]|nr:hypothetical protein BDF19DRAFT_452863 [Syncephalis fuscata]
METHIHLFLNNSINYFISTMSSSPPPPSAPQRQYLRDENPPSSRMRASMPAERLNAGPETWRFALNDDEISREHGPPQQAPNLGVTRSQSGRSITNNNATNSRSSINGDRQIAAAAASSSRTNGWHGDDEDAASMRRVPRALTAHRLEDATAPQGPPPSYHDSRADPLFLRGSTSHQPTRPGSMVVPHGAQDEKAARLLQRQEAEGLVRRGDGGAALGEGYGQEERQMISSHYNPDACWCPRCETSVIPRVIRFPGVYAVILAVIILVIFWPLFWIPFLFPECMDKRYRCPNCGATLTPPHDNIY